MYKTLFIIFCFLNLSLNAAFCSENAWAVEARDKFKLPPEEIDQYIRTIQSDEEWGAFKQANLIVRQAFPNLNAVKDQIKKDEAEFKLVLDRLKDRKASLAMDISDLFPDEMSHPAAMSVDEFSRECLNRIFKAANPPLIFESFITDLSNIYCFPVSCLASENARRQKILGPVFGSRVVANKEENPSVRLLKLRALLNSSKGILEDICKKAIPKFFAGNSAGPYLSEMTQAWDFFVSINNSIEQSLALYCNIERDLAKWFHNSIDSNSIEKTTREDYDSFMYYWGQETKVGDGLPVEINGNKVSFPAGQNYCIIKTSGEYHNKINQMFWENMRLVMAELYLRAHSLQDITEYLYPHTGKSRTSASWVQIRSFVYGYQKNPLSLGVYSFPKPSQVRERIQQHVSGFLLPECERVMGELEKVDISPLKYISDNIFEAAEAAQLENIFSQKGSEFCLARRNIYLKITDRCIILHNNIKNTPQYLKNKHNSLFVNYQNSVELFVTLITFEKILGDPFVKPLKESLGDSAESGLQIVREDKEVYDQLLRGIRKFTPHFLIALNKAEEAWAIISPSPKNKQ